MCMTYLPYLFFTDICMFSSTTTIAKKIEVLNDGKCETKTGRRG